MSRQTKPDLIGLRTFQAFLMKINKESVKDGGFERVKTIRVQMPELPKRFIDIKFI